MGLDTIFAQVDADLSAEKAQRVHSAVETSIQSVRDRLNNAGNRLEEETRRLQEVHNSEVASLQNELAEYEAFLSSANEDQPQG